VNAFVLDASLTMTWCFDSETTVYSEGILTRMEQGEEALVPTLWRLEVVNALLKAQRRGRVIKEKATEFLAALREFAIEFDGQAPARANTDIFELGARYQLSSYDAAYLELALRRNLPLATLDNGLIAAAKEAAVPLVEP